MTTVIPFDVWWEAMSAERVRRTMQRRDPRGPSPEWTGMATPNRNPSEEHARSVNRLRKAMGFTPYFVR
jgi:hypothetical protein